MKKFKYHRNCRLKKCGIRFGTNRKNQVFHHQDCHDEYWKNKSHRLKDFEEKFKGLYEELRAESGEAPLTIKSGAQNPGKEDDEEKTHSLAERLTGRRGSDDEAPPSTTKE